MISGNYLIKRIINLRLIFLCHLNNAMKKIFLEKTKNDVMKSLVTIKFLSQSSHFLLTTAILFILSCNEDSHLCLYKLYFGMNTKSGEVSETDFRAFVDTAITLRFPDGLTVYTCIGQWNENGSVIKEKSRVVEIAASGNVTIRNKISEIRESYKKGFNQSSVMLVIQKGKVDF
jgi:hypothetical protein